MTPRAGIGVTYSQKVIVTQFRPNVIISQIERLRTRVVLVLGYSPTVKRLALSAFDAGLISKGWTWIGPSDVLGAQEAVISAPCATKLYTLLLLGAEKSIIGDGGMAVEERLEDAKQALSGWVRSCIRSSRHHAHCLHVCECVRKQASVCACIAYVLMSQLQNKPACNIKLQDGISLPVCQL